jgi:PIN domain nuclease of toxin-antitoxin system
MDTHVWWWALNEQQRLSDPAKARIESTPRNHRYISAISLWEFAMMATRGRIELDLSPEIWMERAIAKSSTRVIPLDPIITTASCTLPGEFHSDPADRIIVATARVQGMPLVTKDALIREYPHVATIW